MKNLTSATVVACILFATSSIGNAMDTSTYTRLANETIRITGSGVVPNISSLIAAQKQLVALGVEGSLLYIKQHPEHAAILQAVVDNAETMMKMSLDEIEDQWHQGKFMRSKGFDLDKLDHFGELFSLMDAIIHPATSYIALQQYRSTGDSSLLARASAELIEVVEHVAHIKPSSNTIKVSNMY